MRLIDADTVSAILTRLIEEQKKSHNLDEVIGLMEARTEVNNAPTAPQFEKWISVEDRLPEYQEKVLCFYENGFMGTAVFYGISADPHKSSNDFASYSHDYMTENSKIKFWMPLPEPPKEGENHETD